MSYCRPGTDTQHNTIPGGLAGDSHGSDQTTITFEHLLPEILEKIGRRLDPAEVPKFRSICPLTRSSIPPASRLPIQNPSPHGPGDSCTAVSIGWSKVSTLEKPMGEGATSGRALWLLKFEEPWHGHRRVLDLLSRGRIANLPDEFTTVFDSPQHEIVEICREYTLDNDGRTRYPVEGIHKVLMLLDGVDSDLKKCSVYCIDKNGCIGLWRYGDENWTYLDNPPDCGGYDDIAVYEGKVSVVNKNRSVRQIVSYNWDQCFPSPSSGGNHGHNSRKYLVVSSGDLYLVDKYITHGAIEGRPCCTVEEDGFEVYRWDPPNNKWEEVRSLGDSAFFLFNRCSFAVPAGKLDGCDWNCIYYAEEAVSNGIVKVFNLAIGKRSYHKMCDFAWPVWQIV